MNYLDGAFQPDESAAKHAARITSRTKEINGRLSWWAGITSLMFNLGAFFGITTFSRMAHRHGRRPTFAVAFLLALVSTALTFLYISDKTVVVAGVPLFADVFWMIPIMGFCQISLFGGYAIYFPELFPTRLRSTGTSFCYNVGRFFAAGGPYTLGYLSSNVFGATEEPLRWAGLSMCAIFLLGLAALPFAPETRGQPLPE
jgi:MFS family permease